MSGKFALVRPVGKLVITSADECKVAVSKLMIVCPQCRKVQTPHKWFDGWTGAL